MSDSMHQDIPQVSVVVIAISSTEQLRRCLVSIEAQRGTANREVIVAADSRQTGLGLLKRDIPSVIFLSADDCTAPPSLTALALKRVRGRRVLLTEDSCVANADWIESLLSVEDREYGAVGGAIEVHPGISSSMWAFAYVDFFRYMPPVPEGETASLSVCNVAYRMIDLVAIEHVWKSGFNETEVNEALKQRFGGLWLCPKAVVTVQRNVTAGDAIYERYAFGRLFGATRIAQSGITRRVSYSFLSPALPFLLMGRMIAKAAREPAQLLRLTRSLPMTIGMVSAWSWGEWLGYVTKRPPGRITTAPEIARSE